MAISHPLHRLHTPYGYYGLSVTKRQGRLCLLLAGILLLMIFNATRTIDPRTLTTNVSVQDATVTTAGIRSSNTNQMDHMNEKKELVRQQQQQQHQEEERTSEISGQPTSNGGSGGRGQTSLTDGMLGLDTSSVVKRTSINSTSMEWKSVVGDVIGTNSFKLMTQPPTSTREALLAMGLEPLTKPDMDTDIWKKELFERLDRIRLVCGTLCQLNSPQTLHSHSIQVPNATLPMIKVDDVNCSALLRLEELDVGDTSAPPIPTELLKFFTMNNSFIVTRHQRRRDIYLGGEADKRLWRTGNVWLEADVNATIEQSANGTLKGSYGVQASVHVRDILRKFDLANKHVLVIGSSHPWLESILLELGAARVTTLEYGTIISKHPRIDTLTPDQFRALYIQGNLPTFDGVVTHSSLEHSGLGRYGDALNPWGDILTVARAWCVTRPGGFMYLGIPTGKDVIVSNWHRIYGRIRWPLVTANWLPLDLTDESELDLGMWDAVKYGGSGRIFRKDGFLR